MEEDLAALVLASRLETQFFVGGVTHLRQGPETTTLETRGLVEETWNIVQPIARGGSGIIRLHRRADSDHNSSPSLPLLRAVKEVSKIGTRGQLVDHSRELQAIIKFSQPQACRIIQSAHPPRMVNIHIHIHVNKLSL
jgi:hypothetical protein